MRSLQYLFLQFYEKNDPKKKLTLKFFENIPILKSNILNLLCLIMLSIAMYFKHSLKIPK